MEKELNEKENSVFDLIEMKSFDQLNAKERLLVLEVITEKEYQQHRNVIESARDRKEEVEVLPLILSEENDTKLMIPWYISIGGIAASFLLGMWLFKSAPERVILEVPMAKVDTVYLEKVRIDTIYAWKSTPTESKSVAKQVVPKQTFEATNKSIQIPDFTIQTSAPNLDATFLESKGQSLKNDETFALLEGLNL